MVCTCARLPVTLVTIFAHTIITTLSVTAYGVHPAFRITVGAFVDV